MSEATAVFIYTTLPDMDSARRIGEALVKERLAACANIFPGMRSIYEWQGRLEYDEEVAVIFKTAPERADATETRITALHPYQVPAILRLPVTHVNAPYLEWLKAQTTPAREA